MLFIDGCKDIVGIIQIRCESKKENVAEITSRVKVMNKHLIEMTEKVNCTKMSITTVANHLHKVELLTKNFLKTVREWFENGILNRFF